MSDQNSSIEEALRRVDYHKPFLCDECGAVVKYIGVGEYVCPRCQNKMLDDYGKVRAYLTERGSANAAEIARDTGVSKEVIDALIRENAIENVADGDKKEKCVKCGKAIMKGRYCNECIWEMASAIKTSLRETQANQQAQDQPAPKKKEKAKMYMFDDRK